MQAALTINYEVSPFLILFGKYDIWGVEIIFDMIHDNTSLRFKSC